MLRKDKAELAAAFAECKTAFVAVAVMSSLINLLYLTGSFFVLDVYDRVIPCRSVSTFIGLVALAMALFAFQRLLELIRSRIPALIGAAVDDALSACVFDVVHRRGIFNNGDTFFVQSTHMTAEHAL